jgi:hypothetical protein
MMDGELKHFLLRIAQVLTAMRWRDRSAGERISIPFEKFQADFGVGLVEAMADDLSVGETCRRSGIAALLKRRAVEFLVGAQASWVYAMSVPWTGGLPQAHRNDMYDIWHVVEASAADTVKGTMGIATWASTGQATQNVRVTLTGYSAP